MKENSNLYKFKYQVDDFADLQILRYQVPGFEDLVLNDKILIYYLSMSALEGRDILFDQNNRYNLVIRHLLEAIYENYQGEKDCDDYQALVVYLKRIWFASGIHHHYSEDKFIPEFSEEFLIHQIQKLPKTLLPLSLGQSVADFINIIIPIIFNSEIMPKRCNQSSKDIILDSAENYYGDNITQNEVMAFYQNLQNQPNNALLPLGLNSKLIKDKYGVLTEKLWKVDGLYGQAINKIIYWLEKALPYASNQEQKNIIQKLISFYKTGDLNTFNDYSIAWVKDTKSHVDFVNGFIEVYGDPLAIKASWESIVNFKDTIATRRTEIISSNAQWFEDHSPVNSKFKKECVKGVSAKVITVVQLAGDCYPATPIGINLPNADWIRRDYGSKSVTIENIMKAYNEAGKESGFIEEFVWSQCELDLIQKYGFQTDVLHTDLHECLGHGSGKILDGVDVNALGEYSSTIEEARADLYGLYFIADQKIIELGILPNAEAYKSQYYEYMMNGLLTQLARIEYGKNIEESHMRNRQLIAKWVFERGLSTNIVELKLKDGKTFVVINDYLKLRNLFGDLLVEIQRIKSEGDFEAAKNIVEMYGVKVNSELHREVLSRYQKLNLKPYKGFVNPRLSLVYAKDSSTIEDVSISYDENYFDQMMRYSKEFSSLPIYND